MKKIDSENVKDLRVRLNELLNTIKDEFNLDLSVRNIRYSDNNVRLSIEGGLVNEDGSLVVTAFQNEVADSVAKKQGVEFVDHIIGSRWMYEGRRYTIVGYDSKRPKNFWNLKCDNGRAYRAPSAMLVHAEQIVAPTKKEFMLWFYLDTESDAVRESDVVVSDRVQDYMEHEYPEEIGDKFLNLVCDFMDKGIAKKYAETAYEIYSTNSIEDAYSKLKKVYKKVTK